jgi:hypothetical protein
MKLRAFQQLLFRFRIENEYLERFEKIKTIGYGLRRIDYRGQRRLAQ